MNGVGFSKMNSAPFFCFHFTVDSIFNVKAIN